MNHINLFAVPMKRDTVLKCENRKGFDRRRGDAKVRASLSAFHQTTANTFMRDDHRLQSEGCIPAGMVEVIVAIDHKVDLSRQNLCDRCFYLF